MKRNRHYALIPSSFGRLMVAWEETGTGPQVQRILLPRERSPEEEALLEKHSVPPESSPAIAELGDRLTRFLEGEEVVFPLDRIALERCPHFQQKVLLAEYRVPRGWVTTYGRIAAHLGVPGAARAVGGALARNPFPIIIPCHRAIAAHGGLGGYQGGLAMKRALLEMEGIEFSPAGRVVSDRIYWPAATSPTSPSRPR